MLSLHTLLPVRMYVLAWCVRIGCIQVSKWKFLHCIWTWLNVKDAIPLYTVQLSLFLRVLGCVSVQVKIVCIDGWSSGKLTPRRFSSCRFSSCIQVTVQTGNGSHDLVERNQYCTRLWHWLGIFSHSDGGSTLNLEHIVGSVPVHLHSYAKISVLAYSCYLPLLNILELDERNLCLLNSVISTILNIMAVDSSLFRLSAQSKISDFWRGLLYSALWS
jgi:hypothetical protein